MRGRATTRREVLAAALAGGAGVAAATLTGADAAGAAQEESDAQLWADVLAMEMLAVAVYERVLSLHLLSLRAERAARKVLSQERAHAAAVGAELTRLGQTAPSAPHGDAEIDQQLSKRHVSRSITGLHDEHDALDMLLDMEGVAEGTYYTAISQLDRPRLMRLSAEILASEAQHEAVLGEIRRTKDFSRAAPYAFVEGIH